MWGNEKKRDVAKSVLFNLVDSLQKNNSEIVKFNINLTRQENVFKAITLATTKQTNKRTLKVFFFCFFV